MSGFKSILDIGFDKNGDADYRLSMTVTELSFEDMQRLRAIIPVAIAHYEQVWSQYQQENNPEWQASQA